MSSGRRRAPFLDDDGGSTSVYRDRVLQLQARSDMVDAMYRHAKSQGLDATKEHVSRYYNWYYRWYTGAIATGYLMNRTGVKRAGHSFHD